MNAKYYIREKKRLETRLDQLIGRITILRKRTPETEINYCTELSKLYIQADKACSELEAVRYGLKYSTSA